MSLPITRTFLWKAVSSKFFCLVRLSIKFYGDLVVFLPLPKYRLSLHSFQIQIFFECYFINWGNFQSIWQRCSSKFEMEKAEKMPTTFARKRLLLQKFKCHDLSSNQNLASTQSIGSAFLERVRKVQNSNSEQNWLFFLMVLDLK